MTLEQKELMQELTQSEQWDAVLAYVAEIVKRNGESVLSIEASNEKLVLNKARYDGATALAQILRGAKLEFNKREEEDNGRQHLAKIR